MGISQEITASSIAHFCGSERVFFDPIVPSIRYTGGVKFLRDNGANWLVVDTLISIAESMGYHKFIAVILQVKDGKGVLSFTDGNDNQLRQPAFYEYTDFPLPTLKMFYADGILMLAGEY